MLKNIQCWVRTLMTQMNLEERQFEVSVIINKRKKGKHGKSFEINTIKSHHQVREKVLRCELRAHRFSENAQHLSSNNSTIADEQNKEKKRKEKKRKEKKRKE